MRLNTQRNRLKVLRAERGFTQIETADLAHMSRFRYWRIENGDLEPTPDERAALATVFGVDDSAVFPALATTAVAS